MTIDSDQYASKKMTYFSAPQTDMGAFLPPRAERMLEIGCGTGATSAWLQRHGRVGHTIGIDLFHSAVDVAQSCLNEAYVGNIETMPLPIEPASIDVILANDVLEHLVDPWASIRRLSSLLRPDGIFVARIPNVRSHHVIVPLVLRGEWRYEESGVLDRTHLRFFTEVGCRRLFEEAGMHVSRLDRCPLGPRSKQLNRITFGVFSGFLTMHHVVTAGLVNSPAERP